jgi:hypothetical protein
MTRSSSSMYHKEFCRALWKLPLGYWEVGAVVGKNPEFSIAGHVIALLECGGVSLNGIRFQLSGLGDLRSRVIGHWIDENLGELASAIKRDCLGG